MHALLQLPIPKIKYGLKDGLMNNDTFKSFAYDFLSIHIGIEVNIILIITLKRIIYYFCQFHAQQERLKNLDVSKQQEGSNLLVSQLGPIP